MHQLPDDGYVGIADHVTVGITIESRSLSPEEIGERVGIGFDEGRHVGEQRGHVPGQTWRVNAWRIKATAHGSHGKSANDLLPLCIEEVLRRIEPVMSRLRDVVDSETGEFFVHVTAVNIPAVALPRKAIRMLAEAGLSLDVDVVLVSPEDE